MAKKGSTAKSAVTPAVPAADRSSTLLDTRVVYCGDNLEQLAKLPGYCVDLSYIGPPCNSNHNLRPSRVRSEGGSRPHSGVPSGQSIQEGEQ